MGASIIESSMETEDVVMDITPSEFVVLLLVTVTAKKYMKNLKSMREVILIKGQGVVIRFVRIIFLNKKLKI